MCLSLYIHSKNVLPVLEWKEESPEFYITKETHVGTLEMLTEKLGDGNIDHACSHMGCSCGFIYSKDYNMNDPLESRLHSVNGLINYLQKQKEKSIRLFPTS